jgi:tetratricopeptide (TPR) repeat protein
LNAVLLAKRSYIALSIKIGVCASLIFASTGLPVLMLRADAVAPSSFERGCTEMQNKRFREAISCFTEAINRNDKDANSYFRRGQCFFCLNDIEKAMSDFDRAINVTEGNDQYFLWRGTANAQLGKDEPAVEDFLRAFRLNPELVINYNKQTASNNADSVPISPIAPELQNKNTVVIGNGSNATKDFIEAVKRSSQHLTGYFRPGSIYSGVNTVNQDSGVKKVVYPVARAVNEPKHYAREYYVIKNARHDFDIQVRALDALQTDVEALFQRALDYQALGDPDHASLDFQRLIENQPKEPTYWLARAFFQHQIGSDEQARQSLLKAQELDLTLPTKIDFEAPADASSAPATGSNTIKLK